MWQRIRKSGRIRIALLAVVLGAGMWLTLNRATPAEAHCDSVKGPVVGAAQAALEANDVNHVLPYVKAQDEAELIAAFNQALTVRVQGGAAQALADRYFFETAVRLHRQGEGASYTGLKEDADFGPALKAADEALETGALDEVHNVLLGAIEHGVAEKYEAVLQAREHEAKMGTVAAARERVEAELVFEKYVYDLYQLAVSEVAHGEGHASHGAE